MAAIGKILALLVMVVGLAIMTWSVSVYAERPTWFDPIPESGITESNSANFAVLKAETELLSRSAVAASETWGVQLRSLEEREKVRESRQKAYAERLRWARTGNPKDLIDPANPKSGKGFYEPVVDPATRLYDMTKLGPPVKATDGTLLRGADDLLATLDKDAEEITNLNAQIVEQRKLYTTLSTDVARMEVRAIKMGEIRDSVQAELFFLGSFEVNVYETRETVIRRERQLRNRLKGLGLDNP